MRPLAMLFVLLAGATAHAVTYVVPADREMIQQSDDIVIATGVTAVVERHERGGIVTRSTLRIEEVLKGGRAIGDYLVLTERGGVLGDSAQLIPGVPRYRSGERYLVFTATNRDGEPVTFGMGLGQFSFHDKLALRTGISGFDQNLESHAEQAREAAGFLEYIRGIVAQSIDPEPRYFVAVPVRPRSIAAEATRGSYLLTDEATPFRWSTPSAAIVRSGTAVGANGNASVALALAQWNGTDSDIAYTDGGVDPLAQGGVDIPDGRNAVLFNDPNDVVEDHFAGIGGITDAGARYDIDGETFWDMFEVDVVMNDGFFAQNCYDTVMVHEIGHTLGFRHSDRNGPDDDDCQAPNVCETNAIMNSSVSCGWNGILKQWDRDAAATVYGEGIDCTAPLIIEQPVSVTVRAGARALIGVSVTGTLPLQYQWYEGPQGDTNDPVGTQPGFRSAPVFAATKYWVHVSNACGSVDSEVATVTLFPSRRRAVAHP